MRKVSYSILIILILCLSGFAQGISFAEFQYLTIYEQTIFGERINYFNGDTLWGWVHSNDQIGIMQSPVFYGRVTTSASSFWQGPSYNPIFVNYQPEFNYPAVELPENLDQLRYYATILNHYFASEDDQFRLIFKGGLGWEMWKWPIGLPYFDTLAVCIGSGGVGENTVVFAEGELQVLATNPQMHIDYGVQGRYSVAASGNIWIMDNLRFSDSDPTNGAVDSSTQNMLGLLSEQNIIIANTWENGRDNGGAQSNDWREDVIINAHSMALGESFTFEDQNVVLTAYGGTLPFWYYANGPTPDERGTIHLWGSIVQYRRGYVHRSNHNGSGYLKDYHHLPTSNYPPPPYYPYLGYGLNFSTTSLNFGEVEIGDTETRTLIISNPSTFAAVEITGVVSSNPCFVGQLVGGPYIQPFGNYLFRVYFTPADTIEYEETVTIETDYDDYDIEVYGEGVAGE